jgi:ribosomal protein L14E/L6E/L27E
MTGMLAASKAGHDRDKVYVIIEEDDEYVYLADGRGRTADRPKKKNKRHIQIIKKIQMEKPQGGYRDLEIKRTIKTYQEEAYVKS